MPAHPPPFPWRPLAVLLLALAAQSFLEPPARVPIALALYVLAAGLAVWSFHHGEWILAASPPGSPPERSQAIRILPLLASIPLLGAAFYLFGENKFTLLNLSLWLVGIAFFLRAFWLDLGCGRAQTSVDDSSKRSVFVLLTVILLVAAFFRFYRLSQVPTEPFSDHAEKILDIYDITQGETRIFFPRNTGREAIQFYWTLLISAIFQTGLTFQSLKIGTTLLGFLTLPFIYLLTKEIASRSAGLLAMLFAGIAYWPNVISRVGLRFPLYPLFVAPTFYFLLRGIRTSNRNDFLLSGIFLGFGLHGYTPFRIAPLLVILTFLFASRSAKHAIRNLILVSFSALIVSLPLLRYSLAHPDEFLNRTASRVIVEQPIPVFLSNLLNGLLMFNFNDGNIFVNSIVHRPALDVVTGALFIMGLTLLLTRRRSLDLWLVTAIATLILPSVFSLAYPEENPALNRAAGAIVPVFIVVGMMLEALLASLGSGLNRSGQILIVSGVTVILFAGSAIQNYDLVFRQYNEQYQRVVWRTSEMGAIIREFDQPESVWIVPYPNWVDTRLPGLWAGIPNRDFSIPREVLASTLQLPAPKLFIFKASPLSADFDDSATRESLQKLYPQGELTLHESNPWWQSFWVYFVPAQ